MPDQVSPAKPTATALLVQLAEMRGMIQSQLIRQEVRAIATVSGHPPETSGTPCPPWANGCDHDADGQVHVSDYRTVSLSLAELYADDDLAADLDVRIERGFRGAADPASIAIVVKDRYDIELTVAEAADLIGALAGCIQQLAGQQ